jgi:tetratricopeptide (TPR) repeat protein
MSWGRLSLMWVALAFTAVAQAPKDQANLPPEEGQISPDQLPPEEDKAKIEQHYSFNPLQSKKDVTVGEFYFKKGDFKAAAGRFREATKWNDGNAEAWLRLGDAEDKMKDPKAAHEAWEKYLQLAPDAKNAAEVRKKLEKPK